MYDLFVIGGGSGGVAAARRAASYGCRVGIAESKWWGGTCVNAGCVPKKIMWWASSIAAFVHESQHYGFSHKEKPKFEWEELKTRRDRSVHRLNDIYKDNLKKANIDLYEGLAKLTDDINTIRVDEKDILAKNILIATGGKPSLMGIPGEEYTIDSDKVFLLKQQPKKIAIIGAGYIAVEFCGVFHGLGTETHSYIRFETPLRRFDEMLQNQLKTSMMKQGIVMHINTKPEKIIKQPNGKLSFQYSGGNVDADFDQILVAVGRTPLLHFLHHPSALKMTEKGHIEVDEYQQTSRNNTYALGDVCGKVELTPMAIAAGRRLADRLFGKLPEAKADYTLIPTVIFTHPTIGTIGYTEKEAIEIFGGHNLKIYRSSGINLYYNVFDSISDEKPRTNIKLITLKHQNEKIVGLHIIGMAADEILQGFGVAIKMGATKSDLDSCLAIHPTAAEEIVTLSPWGLKEL